MSENYFSTSGDVWGRPIYDNYRNTSNNNIIIMLPQSKKKRKSLKYCCVCSGVYRGQVLDGRTISLHRFPQNKRLKRVWIQRCKTVMKTFKWNEHKLLCSEHFIDYKGPSAVHTIPSLFPSRNGSKKVFSTSRLPELEEEEEIEEEIYTATPLMLEQESNADMGPSMTTDNQVLQNDCSLLDDSLYMHDNCEEPVPKALNERKKSCKTICVPRKWDWKKKGNQHDKEDNGSEMLQKEGNDANPVRTKVNVLTDASRQTDNLLQDVEDNDTETVQIEKNGETPFRTEVNVLTDASQQTEDYIINDHDYCVNTDCDSDLEYNSLNNGFLEDAVSDVKETLNSAFIEDPNICEIEEVDVHTTQFATLANNIRKNISQDFVVHCTETNISMLQLYTKENASAVKLSVEISSNFTCQVLVHRKPVPKTHELWDNLPVCFDRMEYVEKLCQRIKCYQVCCGNPDEEFTSLVPIGAGLSSNNSPGILAVREGDFHAVHGEMSYSSTIRSVDCFLLTKGNRCKKCSDYRGALRKRKNRIQERQDSKRKYNHTTFKHCDMTRENLLQKLDEQKEEIKCLQSQLWKMKRDFDHLIINKGVEVKDHENMELKDLMSCCNAEFQKSFPNVNSRQRIFWEQQMLHAQKTDSRGMRWHPMIIRWCLYIRQKSSKAYDAMQNSGFINLPSARTLFDYSHYIKSELGFQADVFKMAKEEASKKGLYELPWMSYVGLLFDEIKIKEDLVYDKHSGELIGYCNLDVVGNQMMEFENIIMNREKELAKYILVVMLRSITSNWCFPLCGFATKSITADFLYPIIWKTVSVVESQLLLRVLFFTCDGAAPNRRFFSLHRVGNEQYVYKTENPYDRSRNIFFISDVPHLLKTIRNNFSNSYSHKNSRKLWRNGKDISWLHLVRLFEEHCEVNLYSPCPKLTRNHIDLVSFNYMKVNLAAQVLSDTVANALEEFYGQEVAETVLFIRHINKFFDCLNVRSIYEGRNKRNSNLNPYTSIEDERLTYLKEEFVNYFNQWEMEVNQRNGNFTKAHRASMILSHQTLTGIRISVFSISACVQILLNEGAKFILTHGFNQDPLEQHFGHYRHKTGANNNPSVYEVQNMMTTLRTVHAQALPPKRGNISAGKHKNMEIDNSKLHRRKSVR